MSYIEWQEEQFQLVKILVLFIGWDSSLYMEFPRVSKKVVVNFLKQKVHSKEGILLQNLKTSVNPSFMRLFISYFKKVAVCAHF